MPDNHPRLIRNVNREVCSNCFGEHEFLTRLSKDTTCDAPLAFSLERAIEICNEHRIPQDAITRVPDDTLIVMDDSARRLPRNEPSMLAQYTNLARQM